MRSLFFMFLPLTVLQYEVTYDVQQGETLTTTNYGLLEKIIVIAIGQENVWGHFKGTTQILVLITPCKTTGGSDAAKSYVSYKETHVSIIIDLRNVKAVVGRIFSRGRWGIIDRSTRIASATFNPGEVEEMADESD